MTPEEIEAARLAEEQRLATESQTQNQNPNSAIEDLIRTSMADAERRAATAEARSRELEDRLMTQNNNASNQTQNQTQTQPVDQNQFWQQPLDVINQAIATQVKPLNDFVAQMQVQNQYNALKAGYRNNQGFAAIENMVDSFMAGAQPTHANMQIAIQRAIGVLAMQGAFNQPAPTNNQQDSAVVGNIPPNNNNPTPVANNNPPRNPNFIPPHLRPSPVANNNQPDNKPKRQPLTENERRVLKETNMTEDRYWELLEAGNVVDTWTKKGAK